MTFQIAAEAARNITGEVIPLDLAPTPAVGWASSGAFPIGPIAAISPFNFPLNLSAHKIAPGHRRREPDRPEARHQDPLSALTLGRFAAEAGVPEGGSASCRWIGRRAIAS